MPAPLELDDCSQGLPLFHILAEDAAVAALLVLPPDVCGSGLYTSLICSCCSLAPFESEHLERQVFFTERMAFLYLEEPTMKKIIGGVARI